MNKKFKANYGSKELIIEQDSPEVGWYLYVFENGNCIKDHLQDTLEDAKEQAKEDYSIQETAWTQL